MEMIDIGEKKTSKREAVVEGRVCIKPEVINRIKDKNLPKGDVLEAARLAAILAAKQTPAIVPLCHPIPLENIQVSFEVKAEEIVIQVRVRAEAKTGVEMEALTATAVAALTIYDMCKAFDKDMVISDIRLMAKSGGRSGTYMRK